MPPVDDEDHNTKPIIRRRTAASLRSREGLIRFAKDRTSQNGEDGIIERIFELLPPSSATDSRYCVDVGAWDGKHLSNTHSLLVPDEEKNSNKPWKGILIEADSDRFEDLKALHQPLGNLCLNVTVSSARNSKDSICHLLESYAPSTDLEDFLLPLDFDFLCIDVDGSDYWVLSDLLNETKFRPKVICIEFNPTMPDDLVYVPARSDVVRHGASLPALVELATSQGYVLVETTLYNAFFVQGEYYKKHLSQEVPDTRMEVLHETTMGTTLYQLYDGSLKLWGCKKLLWHRMAIDEDKLQMIPREQRGFPFVPNGEAAGGSAERDKAIYHSAIDISAYCDDTKVLYDEQTLQQQRCSRDLLEHLKRDGFCLIRGTGIPSQVCRQALGCANAFLQTAPEFVRRSCLAKDRARRGYSPMCTENFASLIGQHGPNDLVRKFRVGPETQGDVGSSSLLQPNVWPSPEVWPDPEGKEFKGAIKRYYQLACEAAHNVVRAICYGVLQDDPSLAESMNVLTKKSSLAHSSILTLLSYCKGSRHANMKFSKKKKSKVMHPLVASHTDVGVVTMLIFDSGNCASLQRKESNNSNSWLDVKLPNVLPDDPVFVVNIADCLSEVSQGFLPSTLHRVVPGSGLTPRNCLALFAGLDPHERLMIQGEDLTYEEWRKRRIDKAQTTLKASPVPSKK